MSRGKTNISKCCPVKSFEDFNANLKSLKVCWPMVPEQTPWRNLSLDFSKYQRTIRSASCTKGIWNLLQVLTTSYKTYYLVCLLFQHISYIWANNDMTFLPTPQETRPWPPDTQRVSGGLSIKYLLKYLEIADCIDDLKVEGRKDRN